MAQVDQFVTITEAKNKLLDLIRNIKLRHQVVAITRGGVPTAVLLSMDQFEGLMETIEILSDSKSLRSIKRSLKQAEAGNWSHMRECLGARGREELSSPVYFRSGRADSQTPSAGQGRNQARHSSPTPVSSGRAPTSFRSFRLLVLSSADLSDHLSCQ